MNSPSEVKAQSSRPHLPVMPSETMAHASVRPGERWVDCTLGFGGHASLLLEAGARLYAIDQDDDALAYSADRLAPFGLQATLIKGNFAQFESLLDSQAIAKVDGILADVGVSSHQLDHAERGFSFSKSGPVDMRMNASEGETALDLIKRSSVAELAHIIRTFGEEPFAGPIARALTAWVQSAGAKDTASLADAVVGALPQKVIRKRRKHGATKTFQALRIAVNDELGALESLLEQGPRRLAPGGRFLVISFHSLEDRMVKRAFRKLSGGDVPPPPRRGLPPPIALKFDFELMTKKAITASVNERLTNPRARSARLRGIRRLGGVAA